MRITSCIYSFRADESADDYAFRNAASFTNSEQIYNVVPGDFTHDGTLDLLVMSHGSPSTEIKMELHVGRAGSGFGKLRYGLLLCMLSHLLRSDTYIYSFVKLGSGNSSRRKRRLEDRFTWNFS